MKTCKNFCKKYVEKIRNGHLIQLNKTKKKLKEYHKKPKTTKNLKKIKEYKHMIQFLEKNYGEEYELWNEVCKLQFCNPGCKKTIFEHAYPLIHNFSPHTNADYLRKEGATSGCVDKPFFF